MANNCHQVEAQALNSCDSDDIPVEKEEKDCCGDDCHCFCCGYFGHIFTFSTIESNPNTAVFVYNAALATAHQHYAHLHNSGIWQPPKRS